MTRTLETGPEFLFPFAPPMFIHHDDFGTGDSLRGPRDVAGASCSAAFDGAGVWLRVNGAGNLRQCVNLQNRQHGEQGQKMPSLHV
jgi:hypothetical protein